MSKQDEFYLDFSGWLKLNHNTRMEYSGENESKPKIITVLEWSKLSEDEQQSYILEDFTAAIRDAEHLEYTELSTTINEGYQYRHQSQKYPPLSCWRQ